MIRKTITFFRFAAKAERLMLAYRAWGFTEEQTLARWRADLARALDPSPQTAHVLDAQLKEPGAAVLPTHTVTHLRRRRGD
jgi:hypothetical protein